MKNQLLTTLFVIVLHYGHCGPLRLQKRAAFYIANETACVVDNTVYSNGDPIPTDDPCEACKCRPPGFACVLKECEVKPGCRAVRRAGHCCPDYICGCEHNGRMYRDGDEIRDSQNPCYTCHCQGSSIACAFIDCFFRVDCAPEYVQGECCPHYTNCTAPKSSLEGSNPYLKDKESSIDTTVVPSSVIVPGVSYVEDTTLPQNIETTVIEIFEVETKQPDVLQFNPDAVSVVDRISSEESSETDDKSEENISNEVVSTTQSSNLDSEVLPEEAVSDSDVELKVDGEIIPQQDTEQATTRRETFAPEIVSDVTEQDESDHSIDASPPTEAPLSVENANIEPEEPSNNLESQNPPSDYGKSLKFDDSKESESKPATEEGDSKEQTSETEPKEQSEIDPKSQTDEESETEIKEDGNSTQQPQKLLYIKGTSDETLTTAKIQEEVIAPTSVKNSSNEEKLANSDSDSAEKISLYVGKDSLETESVETVTTVSQSNEQPTTSVADKSDITSTIAENLFNFNGDKLGEQNSTVKPGDVKADTTERVEVESSSAETPLPTILSKIVDDKTTAIKID